MATLNPAHLTDASGSYFVTGRLERKKQDLHKTKLFFIEGLNDIASNFKINPSSNTDIPSPSSSSNSSNPPSSSHHHHPHPHHPGRRHGEGSDPTRKREMRLQKNRYEFISTFSSIGFFLFFSEAARECRRKKKEYIKCLEERVASLETQNKALIEELRQLKELYCQREDNNKKK